MSDEGLIRYANDLAGEVEEALRAGDGAVYSEEEFTRLVLDKLGDEGVLDNPIPLYQEGTFGRTRYKITGFSIPDAEDRLLLVTTVHTARSAFSASPVEAGFLESSVSATRPNKSFSILP
jgi:hypothetical protein